jgi:hypothetical protein
MPKPLRRGYQLIASPGREGNEKKKKQRGKRKNGIKYLKLKDKNNGKEKRCQ